MQTVKRMAFFALILILLCPSMQSKAASCKYVKEYPELNKKEKTIANQIMTAIRSGKYYTSIEVNCSDTNYDNVLNAIQYTYFRYTKSIHTCFRYSKSGNQIIGISIFAESAKKKYNQNLSLEKTIKKWTKNCLKKKMSSKEKKNAIVKYLAKKAKYSNHYTTGESILLKGKGCCEAYASVFEGMCKAAGLSSCRTCLGKEGGYGHAWNVVKIGKKWTYVDPTFYDTAKQKKYIGMTSLPKKYKLDKKQYSIFH